jgi:hypothetical protein
VNAGDQQPDALRWHDDEHRLWLQLVRSDLVIATTLCPHNGDPEAPCRSRQAACIVQHFIERFGLDCNVGVCAPAEYLDIAWAVVGDKDDLDLAQVWVIPTSDDVFAAWRATQDSA